MKEKVSKSDIKQVGLKSLKLLSEEGALATLSSELSNIIWLKRRYVRLQKKNMITEHELLLIQLFNFLFNSLGSFFLIQSRLATSEFLFGSIFAFFRKKLVVLSHKVADNSILRFLLTSSFILRKGNWISNIRFTECPPCFIRPLVG